MSVGIEVTGLDEPSTQADPADVVVYAPSADLVTATRLDRLAPNPPRKKKHQVEYIETPYGGFSWLLVRTAIVRAQDWSPRAKAPYVRSANDVAELCRHLVSADQEVVVVLAMNNAGEVLAIHEVAVGGSSGALIEAKHIGKVATLVGAIRAILVHNHPSGDPKPSPDDFTTTARTKELLECVGISYLDHVIVAHSGWYSFEAAEMHRW